VDCDCDDDKEEEFDPGLEVAIASSASIDPDVILENVSKSANSVSSYKVQIKFSQIFIRKESTTNTLKKDREYNQSYIPPHPHLKKCRRDSVTRRRPPPHY